MKHVKWKIIMSATGILLGIVMLMSASYAWLTISVTPEIKRIEITVTPSGKEVPFEFSIDYADKDVDYDPEKATWTTQLHLSEEDVKYKLRPVSTVDGEHWYLPKYSAKGDVNGFWELPDDMTKWANRPNSEDNYLYYVDVYVRSRNQDTSQEMVISNPILGNVTAAEQHYANYVLWDPEWVTENGVTTMKDNDAMACVRVGFQYTMLDKDGRTEKDVGDFYIYEPNADMRSADFTEFLNSREGADRMAGQIYTLSMDSSKVNEYKTKYAEGEYYPTYVPKYDSREKDGYRLVSVNEELDNRLVAQKKSNWDTDTLTQGTNPTSGNIKNIGALCIVEGTEEGTKLKEVATTSREELTTVTYGTIQKMRIFVWIEGQDIDCWNQVADGNLYVNLEFMGRAGASIVKNTEITNQE